MLRPLSHAAALGFGALVALFVAGPPVFRANAAPISVSARPLPLNPQDPGQQVLGPLRYLGGLHLSASDRRFGGISGIEWESACQRLLAVTDTGAWIILSPEHRDGRLTGLSGPAHIAAIRDRAGNAPARKALADAEAMSRGRDGATFVWFERQNIAQRYQRASACAPASLDAAADRILTAPAMARWPENDGPEAAARFFADQLVITEDRDKRADTHEGLILSERGQVRATIALPLPKGFRPTALALLDEAADGRSARYILLARQFSPSSGVAAQLFLITVPAGGGSVTPTLIAELRPPLTVDNMEAVAIRREGDRTILYLASDDNFNPLQRTILLAFQWDPPVAAPVR